MASLIEWLLGGETWNFILARNKETGKIGWFCEKIAPECAQCYAECQNVMCGTNPGRYGNGIRYAADQRSKVEIFLSEKALMKPLHWREPRMVFPCSMTDIFGYWVTDEMLDRALAVMALCRQHTFIVLTKRPDRAFWYLSNIERREAVRRQMDLIAGSKTHLINSWPLPNMWLLTSAGTQKTADAYVPWLIKTPAAVRGISAEPLLEMVDISRWLRIAWQCSYCRDFFSGELLRVCPSCGKEGGWSGSHAFNPRHGQVGSAIDWVIAGGESGSKARPLHIDHVRSLMMQCQSARVPMFVKQLGSVPVMSETEWRKPGFPTRLLNARNHRKAPPGTVPIKLFDKKGGNPEEWPINLRAREFPKSAAERASA